MPLLGEIAQWLGARVIGDADLPIRTVAALESAQPGEISFVASGAYLQRYRSTRAAAVVVPEDAVPEGAHTALLIVKNAELAFAELLRRLAPPISRPDEGVHSGAVIDVSAVLGENVRIAAHVTVGANARVGARTVLHAGVRVGAGSTIGDDCELWPGVVVSDRVTIGSRVVIHPNSVIGADGFGYRWDGKRHAKVPHIGTVVIEDDVEIGSCTCIDRAKFGETRIGSGTRIDNLVQIAHNVRTGRHCIICGNVGLSGSVELGDGVVLAGGTGSKDHVKFGDRSIATAAAIVLDDVPAGQTVSGVPARAHSEWLREQSALRRLPALLKTIRELERRIADLEASGGSTPD